MSDDLVKRLRVYASDFSVLLSAATATKAADALEAMAGEVERLKADKDIAYSERNQLVAFLTRCFPSWRARTDIPGWSSEWHGCVYIETPEGQLSWHYHDSEAHLFAHLDPYPRTWDGHTTEDKYQRLARLQPDTAERDRLKERLDSIVARDVAIGSSTSEAVERIAAECDCLVEDAKKVTAERDRLKVALSKKLSAKAREKLGDLSESMIAMGDGHSLEMLLNWYDESRKALGGDAS